MAKVVNVKRQAAARAAAPVAMALVVMAAACLFPSRPAGAQSAQEKKAGIDASIQQVQGQLDGVDSQEVAIQLQIDHARAVQASLEARVASYDGQLHRIQGSLATAQASLDRASATLVATELRLTEVRRQAALTRARLKQDAVTAYMDQPGNAVASAVLDMRSVNQLETEIGYLQAVAAANSRDYDHYQLLARQTRDLEATQQSAQRQALAERNVVQDREVSLATARQSLVDASAAQAEARSSLASLEAQLAGQKQQLEAELAGLQSQSDQITALIRAEEAQAAAQASGGTFTGGQLSLPVPGAPITSPYGMRVDPILHVSSLHTGIDFGAPYGTPIHAAADGVVVAVGPEGGYGNATILDHGGGIATLYGHQEQILVSAGQRVSRGQVIGLVGCTGWCTGPHVHFEVRVNGSPVDPAPYLGL